MRTGFKSKPDRFQPAFLTTGLSSSLYKGSEADKLNHCQIAMHGHCLITEQQH